MRHRRETGGGRGVLAAALLLGTVLRLWLSVHEDGIYWPDEIYQSLEPAHRLVFGYGLVAWEYAEGARGWALPAFVAAVFKLSVLAAGGDDPAVYLTATRIVFALIGTATALGSYLLARAYGASRLAAACGAAFFALGAPCIYLSPRALGETASALPVVLGFFFAARRPAARPGGVALGAALLVLSVLLRLQNGLFCAGLLGVLLLEKRRRAALECAGILMGGALLFGLLDALTWGGWFHSARVYLQKNLVEQHASDWGTAPFLYYGRVLWSSMPTVTPALLVLPLAARSRAPGLLLTALAYLVAHSLVPHKEMRYIFPALPLLCALAGVGLEEVAKNAPAWLGRAACWSALGAAAFSAAGFQRLTFGQLGQYSGAKAFASAYDDSGPVNRLLRVARQRPDLCGLKIEAVPLAWTGGYSYLHRPVPLYSPAGPPPASRLYNYVIAPKDIPLAGMHVATDTGWVLVRTSSERCKADGNYSWRLER